MDNYYTDNIIGAGYIYPPWYITTSANSSAVTLENIYYGYDPAPKGLEPKKEKDMDVGGSRCHLCGAPIEYKDVEVYCSKFGDDGVANRIRTYNHITYECGTCVDLTTTRKGCVEKNKTPVVHVGQKCIKVPVNQ